MRTNIMLVIIALVTPVKQYAQTPINRTIAVKPGQAIEMHFDYPELIRVSTWEKNEISLQGTVSINAGENDDAFIVETEASGTVVKIHSEIRDLKNLPQRVTVNRGGEKIIFRDKTELEKYQATHGKDYNYISMGPDIEIILEIKLPRNVSTRIRSVYGIVEIKDFQGPLTVDATYGGVDASLVERSVGELTAETSFGQIYTNLDLRFSGEEVKSRDFHTSVTTKPGSGPKYTFISKFGNVYLRKAGG